MNLLSNMIPGQQFGWVDFNDLATATTPISMPLADTLYTLTNDGLGPNTNLLYALPGTETIWDSVTNQFDFTMLNVGDVITVRGDFVWNATTNNTDFHIGLELGIGTGSVFTLPMIEHSTKLSGSHQIIATYVFYIGADFVKNNPGRMWVESTGIGDSVKVNGWFIQIQRR
jgi:hypothetical protein